MGFRKQYLTLVLLLSAACYLQLFLLMRQTDFNMNENHLNFVRLPNADRTGQGNYRNILVNKNEGILTSIRLPIGHGSRKVFYQNISINKGERETESLLRAVKPRSNSSVKNSQPMSNSLVKHNKNGTIFNLEPQIPDKKRRELDVSFVLLKKEIGLQKTEIAERTTKSLSHRCHRNVHLWANRAGELGFSGGKHLIRCPRSFCDVQLTVDMSFETMQKNEALVLFHWSQWDWEKMHSHRPAGQKWVFYTLESPRHTRKHVIPPERYYNTTYDYVMTYRYDSDFRADYGQYIPGKPEIEAEDDRNWAQDRSKLVLWMASNCGRTSWPREDFVQRLARYIPVDMYGRCGNLTCKAGTKECDKTLRQYKFFLALENSECTDYITEKFWIQSFLRELVPIVFGPPRSDYEKVAPPNSFIHIQDFRTTQELAQYLKRVDSDDALYNTYFQWKKVGSLKPYGTEPNIMCQLGDRLEADERAIKTGTYVPSKQKDWRNWWTGSCKRRGEIPE